MPSSADSPAEVIQLVWAKLGVPRGGKVRPHLKNIVAILEADSRWAGVLAFDEFRNTEVKLKPPPFKSKLGALTDNDDRETTLWLSQEYNLNAPKSLVNDAICLVAARTSFNPLADWLRSLKWDGRKRIDEMLINYFGVADKPYTREVSRNLLIGAVNRVFSPGVALHEVVILEGPQGAGKSRGVKALFGKEYFSDTPFYIGNRDAYISIQGKWCIELGEMRSARAADVDALKLFISSPIDSFRAVYGKRNGDVPRQCVFLGTTNDAVYLRDQTGDRRWLPIEVGPVIKWDDIELDREQLWAEAVERCCEDFWLSKESRGYAIELRAGKRIDDPWLATIEEWLESREGPFSVNDILEGALEKRPGDQKPGDGEKVGKLMGVIPGWEKKRLSTDSGRRWKFVRVAQVESK